MRARVGVTAVGVTAGTRAFTFRAGKEKAEAEKAVARAEEMAGGVARAVATVAAARAALLCEHVEEVLPLLLRCVVRRS